mgnify:CR=1 FL=1
MRNTLVKTFMHGAYKHEDEKPILGRRCFYAGSGEERTIGFSGSKFDTVPMAPDVSVRKNWHLGLLTSLFF